MSKVKKVDCAHLPPCAKTVNKKLQRAHYVSILWGKADLAHPRDGLDPLNYGWKEINGCYIPEWFTGPALPNDLFKEVKCMEDVEDDHESDHAIVAGVVDKDDLCSENGWSDDTESEAEL